MSSMRTAGNGHATRWSGPPWLRSVAILAALGLPAALGQAGVVYVDDSAPAGGNGQSWATPWRFLKDALAYAAVPANGVTEIRVAGGTYRPDQSEANPAGSNLRTETFLLVKNVAIRGGYAGFGAGDPELRDLDLFPTTLTGDVGTLGAVGDNAFSVLQANANATGAVLDGLVVTGGNADGSGPGDNAQFGGGLYQAGGSITVVDSTFADNSAVDAGGAMYVLGTVVGVGVTFSGNTCEDSAGGGLKIVGVAAVADFTNCAFVGNSAKYAGGAIGVFDGLLALDGCVFDGNFLTATSGGFWGDPVGGGVFADAATLAFRGATTSFTNNSAKVGGGIRLRNMSATIQGAAFTGCSANLGGGIASQTADVTVSECVFNGNSATSRGGGVYFSDTSTCAVLDCTFDGNTALKHGGGVATEGGVSLAIEASLFTDNQVTENASGNSGGAVGAGYAVAVSGCQFTGNHSEGYAGALQTAINSLIQNCVFENNSSAFGGGALRPQSITKVEDSTFAGNSAPRGGAAYLSSTSGPSFAPFFNRCTFLENQATVDGGGVYVTSNARGVFAACRFLGNTAGGAGGAVATVGGNVTRLVSCLLSGNAAATGGGAAARNSSTTLHLLNCLLYANDATVEAGGVSGGNAATCVLDNAVLWGNTSPAGSDEARQIVAVPATTQVNTSCVQGWTGTYTGSGSIGDDPLLNDPDGPDDLAGTLDDDATTASGSPVRDAGSNDAVFPDSSDLDGDGDTDEPVPADLDGNPRITNAIVDMGAAEATSLEGPGIYVGPRGGSWFVPGNWSGGAVPDASTTVFVQSVVVIDAPGALAAQVQVLGGTLVLDDGTLVSSTVQVGKGGTLQLLGSSALLTTSDLQLLAGSTLDWQAGEIALGASGALVSAAGMTVGCDGDATLTLEAGATVTAPTLAICANGRLRGAGTVVAAVTNDGTIEPGLGSPGTIVVDGNYAQGAGGVLALDLSSYDVAAAHDRLEATGTAAIAGTLAIAVADGTDPDIASFEVIAASSLSGDFATVAQPDPPGAFVAGFVQQPASFAVGVTVPGPRLLVATGGAGGDGQTWATALNDLESALLAARLAGGAIDEIWVAAGSYVPTAVTDPTDGFPGRTATFQLATGLALYGGFAGTETRLEERDIAANPTVLAGDVLGDDEPDFVNRDDNIYRVVTADGVDDTAIIDGFVVRGGYAGNGASSYVWTGAGLSGFDASPQVRNVSFEDNYALVSGGAVQCAGGSMLLQGCDFAGNATSSLNTESNEGYGGAVRGADGAELTIDGCTFTGNRAKRGAGVFLEAGCTATVTASTFSGNAVWLGGGGISSFGSDLVVAGCAFASTELLVEVNAAGGGIEVSGGSVAVDDCTFTDNQAYVGGGMSIGGTASASVSNSDFVGNAALEFWGGGIEVQDADVDVVDCAFNGNTAFNDGGAVVVAGDPPGLGAHFVGCSFNGNTAGSGLEGRGGAVSLPSTRDPSLVAGARFTGCTFDANGAGTGGAVFDDSQRVTFDGCTLLGNIAAIGAGVYNERGVLAIADTTLTGCDVVNHADLVLGADVGQPGLAVLAGGWAQVAGDFRTPTLTIDVGGLDPGSEHDAVDLDGGSVTLDGVLLVDLIDGFVPAAGDAFTLVGNGAVEGGFSVAALAAPGSGVKWSLAYDGAGVHLSALPDPFAIAFGEPSVEQLAGPPLDIVTADFDLDGDIDAAVLVSSAGNTVLLLRNEGVDGSGTWLGMTVLTGPVFPPGTIDLEVAPLDGDGYPDLAAVSDTLGLVSVALNTGTTGFAFSSLAATPVAGGPTALATADVAGTTALDLVVACSGDDTLRVLVNDGAGTFSQGASAATIGTPRALAVADITGNGTPEVVVACSNVPFGTGSAVAVHAIVGGAIGAGTLAMCPDDPRGIAAGDLDGDGDDDILVSAGAPMPGFPPDGLFAGTLGYLRNESGTLLDGTPVPIGDEPRLPALFDADGDGDLEIALVVEVGNDRAVRLVRNDFGDGTTLMLSQIDDLQTPGLAEALVAADLNGDGLPDLLVVGLPGGNGIAGGTTGASVSSLLNDSGGGVEGDLNGDGIVNGADLGLLLANWGGSGLGDLDGSGVVDGADLGVLLGNWT